MVAAIWDDRLAEVWAAPGRSGSGVVVGATAVLTARHVVEDALDGGKILSRVVRPGAATANWVPMAMLAKDRKWDVALLRVDDAGGSGGGDFIPEWLKPLSRSPAFVRLGGSAEEGCEAVGFPQSEVQDAPDGDDVQALRQSEQVRGILLPAGHGRRPVNPQCRLPKRLIPFDVTVSTPHTAADWGGMSGAGVVLGDGRLAGLVVYAESGHQRRRLYVVPFSDALAESGQFAAALAEAIGGVVVIEARDAPRNRDVLEDDCLAPDGTPVLVRDANYRAFGVKVAGVPGEPSFLDYVPRDVDQMLRDSLEKAEGKRRVLLVVGGSAGGKSRSAAEAVRVHVPDHRLLCPRQGSLARLLDLSLADHGPTLVWLDDAERYEERAFRDTVKRLLRSGAIVVATIRRTELERLTPKGGLRNPLGEALTDRELVVQVPWPVIWSEQDRARVREHVGYRPLLAWVEDGKSPSLWVVAGPYLQDRLRDAEADDERPARRAVVRMVLDWYRTGIARPLPAAAVTDLLPAYLPEAEPAEIEEALQWAFESVTSAGRSMSQSLLSKTSAGDGITVHDYIQDADAGASDRAVTDAVWMAALHAAPSKTARFAIGLAAAAQSNTRIASEAWSPLAAKGNTRAMFNLGVLLKDSDPSQARRWHEKAARAGNPNAMNNLGVLLADSHPDRARRWFEKAAKTGNPDAMHNLGVLLAGSHPARARRWFEEAARTGDPGAMNNLGELLKDSHPDRARRWYKKAVKAGHPGAMHNLGMLLEDSDPDRARRWYKKAAEAGHTAPCKTPMLLEPAADRRVGKASVPALHPESW